MAREGTRPVPHCPSACQAVVTVEQESANTRMTYSSPPLLSVPFFLTLHTQERNILNTQQPQHQHKTGTCSINNKQFEIGNPQTSCTTIDQRSPSTPITAKQALTQQLQIRWTSSSCHLISYDSSTMPLLPYSHMITAVQATTSFRQQGENQALTSVSHQRKSRSLLSNIRYYNISIMVRSLSSFPVPEKIDQYCSPCAVV